MEWPLVNNPATGEPRKFLLPLLAVYAVVVHAFLTRFFFNAAVNAFVPNSSGAPLNLANLQYLLAMSQQQQAFRMPLEPLNHATAHEHGQLPARAMPARAWQTSHASQRRQRPCCRSSSWSAAEAIGGVDTWLS